MVAGPSTGAIALWSTVDPLQINGEIILYELRYSPLNGGEGGLEMSANTTGLIVRPDDLKGDTEYRFRLRAYNRGGPGPYTSTRTIRTLEGGKLSKVATLVNKKKCPMHVCFELFKL